MLYKATFLAGFAAGYVLGTKAGRERYETIKRTSRRVAENPSVQEAAGVLQAQANDLAVMARRKVTDKLGEKIPTRLRVRTTRETTTYVGTSADGSTGP